jgi:phosphate starvation-inducible protein PhoH
LTRAEHKAFGDYRIGRRRPSYAKLEQLVELLEERGASEASLGALRDVLNRRLLLLEVVEIQASRSHVFDLSVPGTHSFVANGFINHNTYLAVAQAIAYLMTKQVNRIILARPAVEAGEKLGFLPGDLQQKVDPYLRPLYDALYDLIDYEKVERLFERNQIEVAPIAFMRGRTLSDAFVIIDEAQNTTTEQMKMVLTRIGLGSKVVVTGDITQIDLPTGRISGLVEAISVLSDAEGIAFCYFDEKDVVRHRLVQSIIKAYERWGSEKGPAR